VGRWDFTKLVRRLKLNKVDVPQTLGSAYNPRQVVLRSNAFEGLSLTKLARLKTYIG
jgi:hypothetical protein